MGSTMVTTRRTGPRIFCWPLVPNRGRSAVLYGMGTNEIASTPGQGPDRDPAEGARAGEDRADWGGFLATHRDRLRRMVALRLDQRLRGRIDPSDVIQEAFLEATAGLPNTPRRPSSRSSSGCAG